MTDGQGDFPGPAATPDPSPAPFATPSVFRRLAAFLYEGVLLFGVLMIAGYLYSSLSQMRHALVGRHGLQVFLFLVLGIYFAWFWSHGGQTVAAKAWHIRVVTLQGQALSQGRALARYLLSWLWFVPALLSLWWFEMHSGPAVFGVLTTGVLAYAGLARLHPDRQFLHDALCGTRLIDWRPPRPRR